MSLEESVSPRSWIEDGPTVANGGLEKMKYEIRTAVVTNNSMYEDRPSLDEVRAYLPETYSVVRLNDGTIVIVGYDEGGWTLDGYVIPRLASGLIWAREVAPTIYSV